MAPAKRNIGQEILEGIRQLKRGGHGRIVNVPSVASIREKTGLSQPTQLVMHEPPCTYSHLERCPRCAWTRVGSNVYGSLRERALECRLQLAR